MGAGRGYLEYFKYHPGEYLVAWHEKSSTLNERTTFAQRTPSGLVVWRQIAGAVARRIRWFVEEGEQVEHGQEAASSCSAPASISTCLWMRRSSSNPVTGWWPVPPFSRG